MPAPADPSEQLNYWLKKEMNFSLKSCEKSNCEKYKKMYLKDDKVYIDYDSDVSDIAINATLTFPDKTTQQIQFPYSFKAKQLGTHTIEAEATKQGHKTITEKYEFGVIKEHANVESAQICNADNKCSDKETYQNCPQDCKKGEIANPSNSDRSWMQNGHDQWHQNCWKGNGKWKNIITLYFTKKTKQCRILPTSFLTDPKRPMPLA